MADLRTTVLEKYGVDIEQENLLKIYQITEEQLSEEQLEEKISAARKRWEMSVNGANEKNAARDRARLEKADSYEKILRDEKLRQQLFKYYSKSGNEDAELAFAKEYFSLISETKKIDRKDVEFYFLYFTEERKKKKAILDMLKKDFKIAFLGKEESYAAEGEEDKAVSKKKKTDSILITNRFQEATVLTIRKCAAYLAAAAGNETIKAKFPAIGGSLYDFLEIEKYPSIQEFAASIAPKREEAASLRLDKGQDFAPLVDLFNTVAELCEYKDVADNYPEFKLLLRYDKLTPYMFAFEEVKPGTLKGFFALAEKEYHFRDLYDFILNYFKPVYDNFGIDSRLLGSIFREAQKKAAGNKVLNAIDRILGAKKVQTVPLPVRIIHYTVYWPLLLFYLIFETTKAIATELRKAAYPVFVIAVLAANYLGSLLGHDNLLVLRNILFKERWYRTLARYEFDVSGGWAEALSASLLLIIVMAAVYIMVPAIIAYFVHKTAGNLNKEIDWIGLERTFQNIMDKLLEKTEKKRMEQGREFYGKMLLTAMINVACIAVVFLAVYAVPVGFEKFKEKTGYFQEIEIEEDPMSYEEETREMEAETEEGETIPEETEPVWEYVEIAVEAANIRAGAGTDYEVVSSGQRGDRFIMTGNQENVRNAVWYEVYLDEEMTSTGWVSGQVAQIVEE